MKFLDYDHFFCEGSITGLPEYYNSYSSLLFCIIGLIGIYDVHYTYNNHFILTFIYSLFFTLGIGSFGYHWTGNIGWALLDEIPMILLINVGLMYIRYLLFLHNKQYINYYLSLIFLSFFMVLFIVINSMENYRLYFPFFFGIYMVIFIINYIMLILLYKKYIYPSINIIVYILFGALFWIFTENICTIYKYYFFIFGHPLWHIIMAIGFNNIIQLIYLIETEILKYKLL